MPGEASNVGYENCESSTTLRGRKDGGLHTDEHDCSEFAHSEGQELVCSKCGLVLEERMLDRRPNWGKHSEQGTKRQNGAPITVTRHDKGLSTQMGYRSEGASSAKRRRALSRMRRQDSMSKIASKKEYNRVYAFIEIRRIVSSLSLSKSVRSQSCSLFKSAQSEDLLSGRSLEGFAAAAVYATCRVQSIPRTRGEIVQVARADEGELNVAYSALNKHLGLPVGPIDPTEYLPRYASELDLEVRIEREAGKLVETLKEQSLIGGKNPSGVAAACLYMAMFNDGKECGLSQTDFAGVADVSRLTISATVTELKNVQ